MKKPQSNIIESITSRYIASLQNGPSPLPRPIGHADALQMSEELFSQIVVELETANALQQNGSKFKIPDDIPPYAIARLLLFSFHVVCINLSAENPDNDALAIYLEDLPHEPPCADKGIYTTNIKEFKKFIRWFTPTISRNGIADVYRLIICNGTD